MMEFITRAELLAAVQQHSGPTIVLGDDAELPRKFFGLCPKEIPNLLIGVICEWHGIDPSLVFIEETQLLFVGFDFQAVIISSENVTVCSKVTFSGVFYHFIQSTSDSSILVVHELGVIKLDARGSQMWSIQTDVVETVEIVGPLLSVKIMDGERLLFELETGAPAR